MRRDGGWSVPRVALIAVVLLTHDAAPLRMQATHVWAQEPESTQSVEPTFRSAVDLLVVEAAVVGGDGAAAPGLTPADFVVEIDGRPRKVVSAELVSFGARDAAVGVEDEGVTTNAPADAGRSILIAVDQETLPLGARGLTESARRWVGTLPPGDRVGLVSLPPPGPRVEFTMRHQRVIDALGRVTFAAQDGASPVLNGPAVSLWEAMRIGEGDERTLAEVLSRECPIASSTDVLCAQEAQNNAYEIAADARARTGPVLGNLRGLIEALGALPGRKDLIVLTGGWVLPEQTLVSQMQDLAAAAAASRVTVHGILADTSSLAVSVSRRRAGAPLGSRDRYLLAQPVDTMAGMTGGMSLQLAGSGLGAFERIDQAMSTYYRLGVEPEARDLDGRSHRLSVKVLPRGLSVRDHRRVVTAVTPVVDATVTAKEALDRVLRTPIALSDLGLRVTSQVVVDPDPDAPSRLVLGVEVSRAVPGYAAAQLLVTDSEGRAVATTGREFDIDDTGTGALFSMVAVPDGRYDIRVAARDADGRMGTVVHAVDAMASPLGAMRSHGLTVFEYDDADPSPLRPVFGAIARDSLMVARIDLVASGTVSDAIPVVFEFAAADSGDVLVREETVAESMVQGGPLTAESALPAAELPPGVYEVRATVGLAAPATVTRRVKLGDGRRRPLVRAEAEVVRDGGRDAATALRPAGSASVERLPVAPFDLSAVLTPSLVDGALASAASYGDAATRASLTEQMRTGIDSLRAGRPDAAASAFRGALRLAPDYRPALAFLGACYAAGGAHTQAAGAWQTAVLADRENPDMHALAIDGWMRADRYPSAVALARQAVQRWPDADRFRRQLAVALLATSQPAEAVEQVAAIEEFSAGDEALLAAAMMQLYRAAQARAPLFDEVRDLAIMRTLSGRYPSDGPRVKLVALWLAEMQR